MKSFCKKHRMFIPVFIIIILIEIAIGVSININLKNNDHDDVIKTMMDKNERIFSYFNTQISQASFVLRRNAAFFRIHGIYLSRDNYTDFLQINNATNSNSTNNIRSFMWVPKISDNNVKNFENFCQKNISPNFFIKQIKNTGGNVTFERVHGRDYYYPITFIEPETIEPINSLLFGLDLNIFDDNFNIIKIANSSSNITATFRIGIMQAVKENPYNYDFFLNYPCFIHPNSNDLDQILGYTSALVQIGTIIDEAIKNLDINIIRTDINFVAFDLTQDNYTNIIANNASLLYKENNKEYDSVWSINDINENQTYLFRYDYNISSRKWVFFIKYTDEYINKLENVILIIIPCIIPIIFLLLDLIIFVVYIYMISLKEKANLEKKKAMVSGQMLGYVNHEIRNPLNVIKGLVQFILMDMLKLKSESGDIIEIDDITCDAIISNLSTVVGSCNMLEHIVTDILDIQKLDSRKLEICNKWIKIDSFVMDIYKTISQKIDEKQTIAFKQIYDDDLILYFDAYRMKQILLNFLTNAIKFTIKGEIILMIEEKEESFKFSISDTGRGITDEAKSKIFQPFNQTKADDASRYGGIGLGLYLCKMLTEIMKGSIGFESTLGIGSCFWVEFPKDIINPQDHKDHTKDNKNLFHENELIEVI